MQKAAGQPGILKSTDNATPQPATSTAQTSNAGQVGKPGALNKDLLAAFQGSTEQKNEPINQSNKPQPAPKITTTTSQPISVQKPQVNNTVTPQPATITSQPNNPSQANKPQPLPKKLVLSFQSSTEHNNNPINQANKPAPTTKTVSLTISKDNPAQVPGQQTNNSQPIQSKTFQLSFQTGKEQNNQANTTHVPPRANVITAQPTAGLNNSPSGQPYNSQVQTNISQPIQSKTYTLSFQTPKVQNNGQVNQAYVTETLSKVNVITSQPTTGLNNSPTGQPFNPQPQPNKSDFETFQSANQTNQQPNIPEENTSNGRRRRNRNINIDCCCNENCCFYNCCCCEDIIKCFNSCLDGIASCFSAMCCCCRDGHECCSCCNDDCCTCCNDDCCTCCNDDCCTCCNCSEDVECDMDECCEDFCSSLFSCGG